MKYAVILAFFLAVAVFADDRPSYSSDDDSDEAKYEFDWSVSEDSNEFGHSEQRDGDYTQGSYYVYLPDGRKQTVTYTVDGDSGYVAEVAYEGEAEFPEESEEGGYRSK